MRVAAGRIAVVLSLAGAAGYVLQADDSADLYDRPAPVAAVMQRAIVPDADTSGRDYFVKSVTPQNSALQMRSTTMVTTRSTSTTFAHVSGAAPLRARPVIITLDDGYRDLYTTAFPILAAHGFTAVAYIVASFVDRAAYVTAAQLVEMDRAGIEIASHNINHADLAGRTSLAIDMYELVQSRAWLERVVGHPVLDFAYLSGQFIAQAVAAVRAAGYYSALTEVSSVVHSEADRYTWTRVRVGGGESMNDFVANLGASIPDVRVVTPVVDVEESGAPSEVSTR